MGMDLVPKRPSKAPAELDLRYNWNGWSTLITYLEKWGVDTSEFDGANNGMRISAKTCLAVGSAIDAHYDTLSKEDKEWLARHAEQWRALGNAGGCLQY
jgi:hypothetical protein